MSDNPLIDTYLAQLARRLPTDVVDELADGLTDTYHRHLTGGATPHSAARAALAEFGDAAEITTAFTLQSPGRRTARMLLATGPAVGACWAAALITGHAWAWPVPVLARVGVALLLLAVVATLATAATRRHSYARTRTMVIVGGLALLTLDAAALTGVAVTAPALAWPLALAACASLTRIGLTVRALPLITGRGRGPFQRRTRRR
jgi:hypothetical protein